MTRPVQAEGVIATTTPGTTATTGDPVLQVPAILTETLLAAIFVAFSHLFARVTA
jgi:hypothetical protein